MAAAPNLPLSAAETWDITIDSTYTPSRQGIIVNQGDQINFENESGVDIIIEFQTAPNANCAGNYYIYNSDVTPPAQLSGPFAIQVGTGAMIVTVSGSFTSPNYSPETVAVPLGATLARSGNLQLDTSSAVFAISWLKSDDPFTPPITQTDGSSHTVTPGSDLTTYTYYGGPNPNENPAGGKVIVQS